MPNDKVLTVDDIPFYDPDYDDPEREAVDDAEAAYELGQAWEDKLVELYRLALEAALNCDGNGQALKALQAGIKYNPKHIIRASFLWPHLFDSDRTINSTELFAAFTICSRCKSKDAALKAMVWYSDHTPTLEELRAYLKEHYGAEGAKKMTLAERCALLVLRWQQNLVTGSEAAHELAAEPEVRRALEAKE